MKTDFPKELAEVRPPSPYPMNRRKCGVTLPPAGRIIPYRMLLKEECPDVAKEAVKSLKEVEPMVVKAKGKKGKKGKK